MQNLKFTTGNSYDSITEIVSPTNSDLDVLTLKTVRLNEIQPECRINTENSEFVLDILAGTISVFVLTESNQYQFHSIGHRAHVFDGKPTMLYLPPGCQATLVCESLNFEGALFSAPAESKSEPVVIFPDEAQAKSVGQDNWQRSVVTSVGDNVNASRLLVGETLNPPGNWSSSPPHKHDVDSDVECKMEEIYLYKLNPQQGYGLQRLYTLDSDNDPFDVTYAVRNNDVVVIPRGYHPVVAAPGYQLLYVWALAGEQRKYGAWTEDPDHAWIKGMK